MFKRIILFVLLTFILQLNFNQCFSMTDSELADYAYIDFYDFLSSYNYKRQNIVNDAYNKKKLNINNGLFEEYLLPAEKYITYLEYRGASRRVDYNKRPFLLNWFKMMNFSKGSDNNATSEGILVDENFDLFFTSTLYSTKGKTYFLITQRTISNAMNNDLKLGDFIKVYLLNLGQQNQSDIPVFIIVGYEKVPGITLDIKNEVSFQQYFISLRNDISERNYDKAKGKIEALLKKYPDNIDLKLNLCLVFNETNFFDKSISCYNDILKSYPDNYDALYGISMANYNSIGSNIQRGTMRDIVKDTTKAINIIEKTSPNPIGNLAMVYYNCQYLRAMAKLELKDISAIDDLVKINSKQPTLVSTDSINYFKKLLGVK